MKRGQSKGARGGNNSAQDLRGGREEDDVVYLQASIHDIDSAPEPKTTTSAVNRYALSASDLMDRSANENTSGRRERSSSWTLQASNDNSNSGRNNRERSLSSVLQGSANSLLKGGAPVSPPTGRRVSDGSANVLLKAGAPVSPPIGKRASDSKNVNQTVSFSPTSPDLPAKKTVGVAPEAEKPSWEAIRNLDDMSSKSSSSSAVDQRRRKDDNVSSNVSSSSSPSSSDSYDANMLQLGMDASDISYGNNHRHGLYRQNSTTSAGKNSLQTSQHMMSSVADLSAYSEEDDFQDKSASSFDEEEAQVACCGFKAIQFQRYINTSRVASAVVRFAPCFLCFPIPVSATDRTVLTRLNILSAIITIFQVAATSWLVIVMIIPIQADHPEDDGYSLTHGMAPNLWSLTGSMYSMGFFGGVIFMSNIVTLKVIQVVNLVGAIRYLWVLLYLLPFEIFFVVSLFDFYDVTHVWIRHWWKTPSMAWFRETYCEPGTAGRQCMVPILNYTESPYSERDWCLQHYEATNCTAIRDAAQNEVENLMVKFYNANLALGAVLVLVLFLVVNTLERIISKPMVQKSRESNVPAWLSLPFLGSTVVGAVFRYSRSSVLSERFGSAYDWVGTAYIVCGGLFMVTGLLGWFISAFSILSSRDKRYKHMSVVLFIVLMIITSVILAIIFGASIANSVALVNVKIEPSKQGDIACGVDTADSCSNCGPDDDSMPQCPEWSLDDVKAVLQTQTKGSAALAAIFFIYSFSASRFGFVLRKHITMYQIDYV